MSILETGTVGVMTPGITVHGIRHGTVLIGTVRIAGDTTAGAVIMADGIHRGIMTGIGHTMAGADIMAVITEDIMVVIMEDIMEDGGILIILIITGHTIVTNMGVG